ELRKIQEVTLPRDKLPMEEDQNAVVDREIAKAKMREDSATTEALERMKERLASMTRTTPAAGENRWQEHFHYIQELALQPGGRLIVIGKPFELGVWDRESGRRLALLRDHDDDEDSDDGSGSPALSSFGSSPQEPSSDLAFSADGRTLFAR